MPTSTLGTAARTPTGHPVQAVDEDNLGFLIEALGEHGWLDSDLVGADGAHACWLLVQHAPAQYQDQWLPLMEHAVAAGTASASDLVYLQDRVNLHHNRPQTHGSQSWGVHHGPTRLWPVTDPATLNTRRAEVGLLPLPEAPSPTPGPPKSYRSLGTKSSAGRARPKPGRTRQQHLSAASRVMSPRRSNL